MRATILALSLCLCFSFSKAQNFDKAKMDSFFTTIERFDEGMGSISIFQDGREVYQKSYGYADVENRTKANSTTKYRIGSITKTFTATIIMKLIEEGRLSLSSKLADYYPQVENSKEITIQHLLQHRSGISNFTASADYFSWNTQPHTKKQLLKRIISGGANFKPDEKAEYSNSNYVLLTFIAEDVTNKKYADLLNEIIIYPCKLENTYVGSRIKRKKNEAYSYTKPSGWEKEKETDMSIPSGAGSIISTPSDLNTFYSCLFAEKIVNKQSLMSMMTLKDNLGLGLFKVPFYDMVGYGHRGGIDGFLANVFYFPENGITVALAANGVVYPLKDILIGTLSIYYGKSYKLPEFSSEVVVLKEDLNKYLGIYFTPAFLLN